MDYVTCGTGSYFDTDKIIPTFQHADKLGVEYAERLKGAVHHAKVQAESHVRTPENAEYVVASGQADMVSIVRGQIADPYLATKALSGRADEVRGCISCNQMCWGRRYRDYWISCLVNPSAGREWEWGGDTFEPAGSPRTVLVVGGGPAGLETARVAAERGHRVTLVEAGPLLGGAFRLAGLQPRRSQITEFIEWYERELARLDVRVQINQPMFADDIEAFGADVVVMATGSQPAGTGFQRQLPLQHRLPGVGLAGVMSIEDVIAHRERPGRRVVLVDDLGDWRGGGTAWFLAERGHEVVIVTSYPMVGHTIQRTSGDWKLRTRLAELGVTWHTESVVAEWTGTGAHVHGFVDRTQRFVEADSLVLATINAPVRDVLDDLEGRRLDVRTVGDVVAARLAVQAIYEGRVLGQSL
jgi:NADPH-dependent 2,4-dienoyl-CoA reductase/sulfur reductase-like enzyme